MFRLRLTFLIQIMILHCINSLENCYDKPLILTPYLKEGNIKEAQEKARVTPDMNGVKSYSGYLTVNEKCGNHFFFWFIPAQNGWEKAPVLLWLNGGPGTSSLMGMFMEIGPFNHLKKEGFVDNKYHWTKDYNVVFLDQPGDTGFSFSEKGCYADTLKEVSADVYSFLIQFFTLFPNLKDNRFFLTGQGIGANYQLATALEIDKRNDDASLKINLKGLIIVNPYIDRRCHNTGEYLYELGLIDEKVRDSVIDNDEKLTKAMNKRNYTAASEYESKINNEEDEQSRVDSYNILNDKGYAYEFMAYVRNYKVRKQIHVGNATYSLTGNEVYRLLNNVLLYTPVTSYLEDILKTKKYIVGFMSGQLNIVCLYTSLPCVLRQLEWSGAEEYLAANRTQWYVDDRLAGWFKVAGNLFEVVFRDSGYLVPVDQSQAALELITAAVSDDPGTKLLTKLDTK